MRNPAVLRALPDSIAGNRALKAEVWFRSGCTKVNSVEFWFMMQIAMLCGFVTSYPVN
jgi:hypothetical protein